ncbi:MAG: hypothetical protein D6742_06660 [Cyanobacteria bacterium J069]|nr:MAG: hypothetical protein D6742_06660 [Cyanobacteria bacterium J069]
MLTRLLCFMEFIWLQPSPKVVFNMFGNTMSSFYHYSLIAMTIFGQSILKQEELASLPGKQRAAIHWAIASFFRVMRFMAFVLEPRRNTALLI